MGNSTSKIALPTPEDLPGADVVIYDGLCQFCTRQVQNLHRWDGRGRLSFLSLHDPAVGQLVPDLTFDQLMEQMYVVRPDGRRWGGAAAFRYLTRRLPLLWPLMPFLHIPGTLPIWQWGYRQVARQRYRWNKNQGNACENDHCEVHFRAKEKS